MRRTRPRVLVVDDADRHLTDSLAESLGGCDVDVARDVVDAIYRIDTASDPYHLIFCDLARGDLPGPELWAYLSITRSDAAGRMVFVASEKLRPETMEFVRTTANTFVQLPQRRVGAGARPLLRNAPPQPPSLRG
ncbi:MAG: hypothetical protein ACRENE_12530 [Polyangiaceae bacterium]